MFRRVTVGIQVIYSRILDIAMVSLRQRQGHVKARRWSEGSGMTNIQIVTGDLSVGLASKFKERLYVVRHYGYTFELLRTDSIVPCMIKDVQKPS